MLKSSTGLGALLNDLRDAARSQRLTDTEWARRAGIRKESLSRMRTRHSCDFATLESLASVVGRQLTLSRHATPDTPSGYSMPESVDRAFEDSLMVLCASGDLSLERWGALGPGFFMAGLAVMIASNPGVDRRGLLELAERLHPGSSQVGVFSLWLERSPVRPSRFLPLLESWSNSAIVEFGQRDTL
jgi:hypothetical protein